jgi:Mrp family chromosome partitioning ATPase
MPRLMPPAPKTPETLRRLRELAARGLSAEQIGDALNWEPERVRRTAREQGIELAKIPIPVLAAAPAGAAEASASAPALQYRRRGGPGHRVKNARRHYVNVALSGEGRSAVERLAAAYAMPLGAVVGIAVDGALRSGAFEPLLRAALGEPRRGERR